MISVVATLFRSESYIREFYSRCLEQLRRLGQEYEFVFVDDGSPDNSLGVVLELMKRGCGGSRRRAFQELWPP